MKKMLTSTEVSKLPEIKKYDISRQSISIRAKVMGLYKNHRGVRKWSPYSIKVLESDLRKKEQRHYSNLRNVKKDEKPTGLIPKDSNAYDFVNE